MLWKWLVLNFSPLLHLIHAYHLQQTYINSSFNQENTLKTWNIFLPSQNWLLIKISMATFWEWCRFKNNKRKKASLASHFQIGFYLSCIAIAFKQTQTVYQRCCRKTNLLAFATRVVLFCICTGLVTVKEIFKKHH